MRPSTNIVVVEDDAGVSKALQRLLGVAGFEATTYPSAEAFLDASGDRGASCLVLDVHLPGLSGFELRRRLAEKGAEVPTIFITAHDEPATREQAARAGAIAYLTKPFRGRALVDAVNRALECRRSPEDPSVAGREQNHKS
jgi:FixJ family two-component response regulator